MYGADVSFKALAEEPAAAAAAPDSDFADVDFAAAAEHGLPPSHPTQLSLPPSPDAGDN